MKEDLCTLPSCIQSILSFSVEKEKQNEYAPNSTYFRFGRSFISIDFIYYFE